MEGDASAGHPGQHQPLSGHKHLTIISMMMMMIMMMIMGVTWLVVEMVCSMPASPGEELAAGSGVVGVAAVPGEGGGDRELSSA